MPTDLYSNREMYEFWRNQAMCVDSLTPSLVTYGYKAGKYHGLMRNIDGMPYFVYGDTPAYVKQYISSEINRFLQKYKQLLETESPTDEV